LTNKKSPPSDDSDLPESPDLAEPPEDLKFDESDPPAKESAEPVDDFQAEFDKLVQLDQDWRDHFAQASSPIRTSTEEEEKRQFMFDSLTAETSLAQHLIEQVRDTNWMTKGRALRSCSSAILTITAILTLRLTNWPHPPSLPSPKKLPRC
jgi:hypothetical protein